LFKQQYDDDMRASPESETARGDYRDNAILDDYSLAASVKQNAVIARIVPSSRPFHGRISRAGSYLTPSPASRSG
jgi:hypothetical protein